MRSAVPCAVRGLVLAVAVLLAGSSTNAQITSMNMAAVGTLPFPVGTAAEVRVGGDQVYVARRGEGFSIVDVSDPTTPTELWNGATNLFMQDLAVAGDTLFVANESGNGQGLYIYDVTNPASPAFLASYGSFNLLACNNLAEYQGIVYCASLFVNQVVIVDCTNPAMPVEMGTLPSSAPIALIHDLAVVGDKLYVSWLSGGFDIYELSGNPTSPALSVSFGTPTSLTHNTVPLSDGIHVATSEEVSGGFLRIYDISNPNNVTLVSQWRASPMAVMHNVVLNGHLAFISNYTIGMRVVDLSDPANPVEVAFFDAFNGTNAFSFGMWGVDSSDARYVYGADFNSGLYVLDLQLFDTAVTSSTSTVTWGNPIPLSLSFDSMASVDLPLNLVLGVSIAGSSSGTVFPLLAAPVVWPAGVTAHGVAFPIATPPAVGTLSLDIHLIALSASGTLIHDDATTTITLQ